MVGKAYTMKELRTIVDYLKSRDAYGQIKGKKIWVDLESSTLTNRTWQSLKEAFLKRILPDIVNPYYKLSREEIASFRVGHSMIKSRGSKLDVKTTTNPTKKSKAITVAAEVHDKPIMIEADTDNNDVVEIKDTNTNQTSTGENTASESVNTLLNSNNCYQTAQDIIKDLLSSTEDNDEMEDAPPPPTPSQKENSSSLNPVLRGILHDFDSDSSEVILTIDENVINKDNEENNDNNMNGEIISKTGENNEGKNNENNDKPVDSTKTAVDESNIVGTAQSINNNLTNNAIFGDSIPCNQEILSKTDTKSDDLPIEKEKKCKRKLEKKKILEKPIDMENKLIPDDKSDHEPDNELVPNISVQPIEGPSISKDAPSAIANNVNDDLSDTEKSPQKKSKMTKVSITKSLKRKNKEVVTADKEDTSIHILSDNEPEVENTENKNSPIENFTKNSTKVSITKSLKGKNEDGNTADKEDIPANTVAEGDFGVKNSENYIMSIENNNNKEQDAENNGTEETNLNLSKPPLTSSKVDELKEKVYNNSKVVLLPSHSESSGSDINEVPKRAKTKKSNRLSRLFGFSSDALNFLMPNTTSKVRTSNGVKSVVVPSSDSDSDTDDQADQQPCIIKWKPEKGPPLENQIFVSYNGKLYPLIKKMNNVTSYCQYQSSGEENVSFWQKKYIEQKKRSAELTRLFEETDENNRKKRDETVKQKTETVNNSSEPGAAEKIVQGNENAALVHNYNNEENTVIKMKSKKEGGSEITLEGRWQNLQPIVSEVMQLFYGDGVTPKTDSSNKDNAAPALVEEKEKKNLIKNNGNIKSAAENRNEDTKKSVSKVVDLEANTSKIYIGLRKRKAPVPNIMVTSATPTESVKKPMPGTSREHKLTPVPGIVDEEAIKARERVKKLEADIFKEIEEKDKLMNEQTSVDKSSKEASDSHVNSRKRRQSLRYSKDVNNDIVVNEKRLKLVKDKSSLELPRPKRNTRSKSTKKSSNETTSDGASVNGIIGDTSTLPSSIYNDDSDTKYKFPSPEPESNDIKARKQALASMKNKLKHIRRKNRKNRSRHSNKANASFGSMDSLQDSDSSGIELSSDRKSKMSMSMRKLKYPIQQERRLGRTRKTSMLYRINNTEANAIEESNVQVPNLDSKIYRSESYELLMNNKPAIAGSNKNKEAVIVDTLSPASQTMSGSICSRLDTDKSVSTLEVQVDNSTNVSCPTSPELSIVENISINRELIEFINSCDDINIHISDNDTSNPEELLDNSVRHMSIVAANIDMMDQKFDIIETSEALKQNKVLDESMSSVIRETPVRSQIITRNMRRSNQSVTDSMLNKMVIVDINESAASESLNEQICNMVIDSAKKQKSQGSTRNRQKPNSRSSTPHRKKISSESNTLGVVSVIDECMEYCTLRTKRNSCPPNIASTHDDELQKSSQNDTIVKSKGGGVKKKKNILKVKIVRPKLKKAEEQGSEKQCNANVISIHNNDITIPDMVHNDSKSRISQKYLEDESVILVEQNNDSVISINSFEPASCAINDKTSNEKAIENDCFFGDTQNTGYSLEPANCVIDDSVLEVNIDNAINKSSLSFFSNDAQQSAKAGTSKSTLSNNSLLTEDISDEILNQSPTSSNSKWYLFSEDEVSNNNMSPPNNTDLVMKRSNEYIKKLFPVVCEVPDLSTITEASHDVDNLKNHKESGAGTN